MQSCCLLVVPSSCSTIWQSDYYRSIFMPEWAAISLVLRHRCNLRRRIDNHLHRVALLRRKARLFQPRQMQKIKMKHGIHQTLRYSEHSCLPSIHYWRSHQTRATPKSLVLIRKHITLNNPRLQRNRRQLKRNRSHTIHQMKFLYSKSFKRSDWRELVQNNYFVPRPAIMMILHLHRNWGRAVGARVIHAWMICGEKRGMFGWKDGVIELSRMEARERTWTGELRAYTQSFTLWCLLANRII